MGDDNPRAPGAPDGEVHLVGRTGSPGGMEQGHGRVRVLSLGGGSLTPDSPSFQKLLRLKPRYPSY